jgi:hypothetical protein
MPAPIQDPPAFVQPADTGLAQNRNIQIDPDTDLTIHKLRVNEATGEARLDGISARAFGRSFLQGSSVPLVDPSTNRLAEPAQLHRQRFHESLSTPSELQRRMEMLGIDRAEAFIAFKPGQEYATLTTHGEFFKQNFEANRAGFSYSVSGAPIREVTEWLTNGRGEFSSMRLWTNGQQFLFAPAYTLPSVVPGFSTTLSGNVSTIMNSTRGLAAQYQHLLSGDHNDPNAGVPVAGGRFTYNSFGMADSVVSTFDFRGERIHSSLYVGTGFNGYNFVAFRGMGDLMGGVAQADALFAQSVAGGSGLGGTLRFATAIEPATLQFSLEGYKQFQGANGEFSPGVGHVLGLEPNSGEYGVRFGLEIRRR